LTLDGKIILFLFLAFVTGVLFVLRKGPIAGLGDLMQIVINFLLLPSALATGALFFAIITRTDPMPLVRQGAYLAGFRQLVLFSDAIPQNLEDNLAVSDVRRLDTDGDGALEWVVFYQFDLQDGRNPVQAVVYDNDRGNPPVIFPYALRPPNRDYLSEGSIHIETQQVIDGAPERQVMVWGDNELNIFKFRQNSETWDFPRDAPARYIPIGFFRGSGGVQFDETSKNVTVIDRNGFERSQLAVRSVYALRQTLYRIDDQSTELIVSYLDDLDQTRLAAPIVSTIDFFRNPPADILETTFPEKIVLAFYAATCGVADQTLCRRASVDWRPRDFLAPAGEAMTELEANNAPYFGLFGFSNSQNLSVTHIRYYPQLERDSDLLVQGGGRDVVTGEEAQFNVVDITFAIARDGSVREETARFEMRLIEGKWKIVRRLPLDMPPLGSPIEVAPSQ
jgi:hypothetical protein